MKRESETDERGCVEWANEKSFDPLAFSLLQFTAHFFPGILFIYFFFSVIIVLGYFIHTYTYNIKNQRGLSMIYHVACF